MNAKVLLGTWYGLLMSTNKAKKSVIAVAHPRPVKYHGGRFLGKKSREFPW